MKLKLLIYSFFKITDWYLLLFYCLLLYAFWYNYRINDRFFIPMILFGIFFVIFVIISVVRVTSLMIKIIDLFRNVDEFVDNASENDEQKYVLIDLITSPRMLKAGKRISDKICKYIISILEMYFPDDEISVRSELSFGESLVIYYGIIDKSSEHPDNHFETYDYSEI